MRSRPTKLAGGPGPGESDGGGPEETLQLVSFELDGQEYAVEILQVREIVMRTRITPMPDSPAFLRGVVNLRGAVIPVVDLRRRLGLAEREATDRSRIVIVEMGREKLGVIVDRVNKVITLPASKVAPAPPIFAGVRSDYIFGLGDLGDRMVILLDLEKAFAPEQIGATRAVGRAA